MFAPATADHENIHGSGGSLIVQSIISARQRAKFRWRTQAKRQLSSVVIWFFDQDKSMCWRKEPHSNAKTSRPSSVRHPKGGGGSVASRYFLISNTSDRAIF